MSVVLLDLYRHNTWATLKLIDFLQTLDSEVLWASVPGTFGPVYATVIHMVVAEEGYCFRVSGGPLWEPLPEGEENYTRATLPPLGDLADRIRKLGAQWELLAQDPDLPIKPMRTSDNFDITGRVSMAQAIHHGNDHRAQIGSILGAHGIEAPELDIWAYALEFDLMREATTA